MLKPEVGTGVRTHSDAENVGKQEILVAFSDAGAQALGNIWRLTAKKADFYLDPLGEAGVAHLSVHAPQGRHTNSHRFHIKVDQTAAARVDQTEYLIKHNIPTEGHRIEGQRVAPHAFLVARIRWSWDLQRPRFRTAASSLVPEIAGDVSALYMSTQLRPNDAWDLDVVVSYGEPYWPDAAGSSRDNARLPALRNDGGMWLTATSYKRSKLQYPAPPGLIPRLPGPGEQAIRIMCGSSTPDGSMYWLVEAITARQELLKTPVI